MTSRFQRLRRFLRRQLIMPPNPSGDWIDLGEPPPTTVAPASCQVPGATTNPHKEEGMATLPAEIHHPGLGRLPVTALEAGQPYLATDGPQIPLTLHTSSGGPLTVVIADPTWIEELLQQVLTLRHRTASGLFPPSKGGA